MNDIDLEIARFSKTWKETQDLDLRIDILLNDKLISHAGPLHPFGKLSTWTRKQLQLPSGDYLRVEIQIDLLDSILSGLLLLLSLESAIVCLFYVLRRSIQVSINSVTSPLESKIAWLNEIARDLPGSARIHPSLNPSGITEIDDLGRSIRSLTEQIAALEENLSKINFDRGRLKMAEHVAHNLKGVIASLQLRVSKLHEGGERLGLTECIASLRDISSGLLNAKRPKTGDPFTLSAGASAHVMTVARSVMNDKRAQYGDRPGFTLRLRHGDRVVDGFVGVPAAELQSILSNLIDNSAEALNVGGGLIDVTVEAQDDDHGIRIVVQDNGHGVPAHILPSLTTEGFSYGKDDGNGIGLFHAKEIVEGASGKIEIQSTEDSGTGIRILLPWVPPANRQITRIEIPERSTIVCVDDDPVIHSIWRNRFQVVSDRITSLVHLSSVAAFESWIEANRYGEFGSRLYLIDFDLKHEIKTGLDLIEEHGIALESLLVSGMVEDSLVKERLSQMGVRYLAKEHISEALIHVGSGLPSLRSNARPEWSRSIDFQ